MTATATPPILRAEAIEKTYRMGGKDLRVLKGVDCEVRPGELLAILGRSGSGKSTLLHLLGGLDRPDGGRVFYDGDDVYGLKRRGGGRALDRYRNHSVGFVFQFYNLIPSLSALENVALVTEISHDPMDPHEALAMVGLEHRVGHFPSELSGGEQQRVAIARAIAKRPDVLLCDEPTGALDSKTGILVLEALTRINEEIGTTTAVITHNADIGRIAHRVFRFRDGRIDSVETNESRVLPSEVDW